MKRPVRYAVCVGDRRLVSDLDTVETVSAALAIPHSIAVCRSGAEGWVIVRNVNPSTSAA